MIGRLRAALSQDRIPLVIAALALALYLPGFTWGTPHATDPDRVHAWGNDDAAPLAALAEMHDTFVAKPPYRNTAYPWFHYFFMASASAPYIAYLFLTGRFGRPSPAYPFGFSDPVTAFQHLTWIVRSLSLLLAIAAVLGAYYAAKHLWGRRAGVFAAVFVMLLFPMAYYARVSNPDMPVLGWTTLGLAVAALSLRKGLTVRRGLWLGAFVALAGATKDQAAGSFILLGPALLWRHFRSGMRSREMWKAPLAACASLLAVYIFASGIPVDPGRFAEHFGKVFFAGTTRTLYLRHPSTLDGSLAQMGDLLGYLVDVMSWPLIVAAAAGICLAVLRDRDSLPLLLSSLGFFLILVPVGMSRVHYLLPVALPLTLFAAYAFDRAIAGARAIRMAALAAAVVIAGRLLLQTVDLTHDMARDSRYDAAAWLARNAKDGDSAMHFGFASKLPALSAGVRSLRIDRERDALSGIADERPDFILVIPQDINEHRQRVEWRAGANSVISPISRDLYENLVDGSLDYRLAAQFQTPRLMPWLDRPFLSYPTVNPPVQIFARSDRAAGAPRLKAWTEAPHYPRFSRVQEITVDHPRDAVR